MGSAPDLRRLRYLSPIRGKCGPAATAPKAQDYAIMADCVRDLRPAKWGLLKKS
jgi:hypothetical protein